MPSSAAINKEDTIAHMFDRIANRYDLLNRLLSVKQDQRWRRRMIGMVPFRPNGAFLDVATGTGDVIQMAAKRHPEYREFLGVDISKNMLSLATKKTDDDRINYQLMNAENLALPDESVDCLTIAFGLRNVIRREKALNEFRRVIKRDGVLLILEFFPTRGTLMTRMFHIYFHYILPLIGGVLSDGKAYRYLPNSVGTFYSDIALRSALDQRGFLIRESASYLFGSCRLISAVRLS